ncbi:MAG TPA: hypothetical protein VK826_15395 [Bacteroidia bacterium]|nr:hypothetical protein [Bacteroidia bacterium]
MTLFSRCVGAFAFFSILFINPLFSQTTLLWSESAGTAVSVQKSFVATDLIGNIYMASAVNGTYGLDWKVSSWRPDSVSRWTYTYNGSGNLDDTPAAIVVDSAFNVYISGTSRSSGSNDIKMIKLDSAGNQKWISTYNRTGSAHDVGTGMAIVGNLIFLSGHSQQSTSNYDYTVLKYDTTGLLLWSRHINGSGSGDDYTTSIVAKANGDVFVTGNAVITGGTRDMMTLRYISDGTWKWTKYYGNTVGQNDYGNAIGINASGDIVVSGQSYVTSTNSNLTTVKYSAVNGTQAWAAAYAGTYGGHDAGYSLVIDASNYIYVTGYTQTGSSNTDYVTIRYQGNGTPNWAQTYNGPGNSTDEASMIIHDGDDVVITGKSTGSGTGLDVTTISMNKSTGSVNWTMRINEAGSSGDEGVGLCRDEMGNVNVTGISQTGTSTFVNTLVKLNQADKNQAAITAHLEILGYGVLGIVNDTSSKRILYDMVNLIVDSFYQANLHRYLLKCDQQSAGTRTLVRNSISSEYGWPSSYQWENIINRRIYERKYRSPAMIYVPGYETFTRTGFISTTSLVAFSHDETDFPILSLPDYGPLDEDEFLDLPTLTLIAKPAMWWHKNAPIFRHCYAEKYNIYGHTCDICGTYPAPDGLPKGDTCNSSTMSHEVGIYLGYNYDSTCGMAPVIYEQCLTIYDLPPITNDIYFAMLYAIPGCPFYERVGQSPAYTKIKKMPLPIYDRTINQFAVALTLCDEHVFFNDFHGTIYGDYTQQFALGWGGIFRISRPGTNQRPLYFTLPYTKLLRYTQGPDMNFYFGHQHFDNFQFCTGTVEEIEEDYFIGPCEICGSTETVFGLTQNQAADILITTDYQTISNFWSDNVVTVCFTDNNGLANPSNVHTFYAGTSTSTCDTSTYNIASLMSSSILANDETYEVRENFVGNTTYPGGTDILIHVQAHYDNGEVINECRLATLATGPNNLVNTGVEIRGNINGYSSSVVNYQVDVYLLN